MFKGQITILGCGVQGLTAGLLLQGNGYNVKIVSRSSPENPDADPKYTSPKAGAHWRSDKRLTGWDERTFKALDTLMKADKTGEFGLVQIPAFEIHNSKPVDLWFKSFIPGYAELTQEELDSFNGEGKFGVKYETICINTPVYLQKLLDEFRKIGGQLEIKNVANISELYSGSDIVINCSGIGALELGGVQDQLVYPTRGQVVLVRAPNCKRTITAGDTVGDFTYVIPRSNGDVILGGTFQPNDFNLSPDLATADDIIRRCLLVCPELSPNNDGKVDVIKHSVGLRPTRKGDARLEGVTVEEIGRQLLLIHCYGHGGYGYQSSWGCGEEILNLATNWTNDHMDFGSRVLTKFISSKL